MPGRSPSAVKTRTARPKVATRSARARPVAKASVGAASLPGPRLLYDASLSADVVTLPSRSVLALEGQGAPESGSFQRCIAAMYGVAYTLKFARKKQGGDDFKIGPLEARWWADSPTPRSIAQAPRETWRWQLRIAMPRDVAARELKAAIALATSRGKLKNSTEATRVLLRRLPAERYGRVLHVGPYAQEQASFERILAALQTAGLRPGNAHLEVYISDPRRTKPDRLKTVLLLEVQAAASNAKRRA
jgi:hypothetical protein